MSKRYTVAQVRERLSEALDQAEAGVPVFIDRHGVRYRLSLAQGRAKGPRRRTPRIDVLDPVVAEGHWTWAWAPGGVKFRPRRKP